jgi:phosphoglycerol transferase MdoB-like AlkP superfamily enzyme
MNKINPIVRKIEPKGNFINSPNKPNVILVLMESMAAANLARNGNKKNLTPFLDNLSLQGCYFENFYGTGEHTMYGVFSTLYSLPFVYQENTMKRFPIPKIQGISTVLKENNYSTIYFTTHDGAFDGIRPFLTANGFDIFIEKSNYPNAEIKTSWGVTDDVMFKYSISELNKLANNNKPFFATLLTVSNHIPYYVPKYFTAKSKNIAEQVIEYADYSLKLFMDLCFKQKWFDNTIFVFVADHGVATDYTYDISIPLYHIPLIIYLPEKLNNELKLNQQTITKLGSQVDISPTILNLLGISYTNYGLGVDLFNEKRKFAVIDDANMYGVIGQKFLLIVNKNNIKSLYKYSDRDKHNYINDFKEYSDFMDKFARAHMQTYNYILKHNYETNSK